MKEDKNNTNTVIKNVEHSTENALAALKQLEKNLVYGRFREGAEPYEIMCKTLLGQKIWSSDKNNDRINRNFKSIASTAKEIVDILTPYVKNLEKLASMDKGNTYKAEAINESAQNQVDPDNSIELTDDEQNIINLLKIDSQRKLSYTKLQTSLSWDKRKLDKILLGLQDNKRCIAIIKESSRKMVVLNS